MHALLRRGRRRTRWRGSSASPRRRRAADPGPATRCSPAMAALRLGATRRRAPTSACELALAALAGGELIEADNGLLSIAAIAAARRRRPRRGGRAPGSGCCAEAHRRGSLFDARRVHLWHGFTLLWRGDLAEAEDDAAHGLRRASAVGLRRPADCYCGASSPRRCSTRGDLAARARRSSAAATRATASDGAARSGAHSEVAAAARRGPPRGGARDGRASSSARFGADRQPGRRAAGARSARSRSTGSGRDERGARRRAEELELARALGRAGHGRPRAARARPLTRDDGIERPRARPSRARASPARLELAKALAALGARCGARGRPTDAREPLRRALELADACGAAALAEQVRAELYAAGARPAHRRADRRRGADAERAAGGRPRRPAATNRDIAQALFVTPKTVEVHLSNAYRKLGIRSRRELPQAMAALTGPPPQTLGSDSGVPPMCRAL